LMGEHQTRSLLVVSNDRRVQGIVWEEDVADAVRHGKDSLPVKHDGVAQVAEDTPLADLFPYAAATHAPLAVINDRGVLVGLIPRVTLRGALSLGDDDIELEPVGGPAGAPAADPDDGEKVSVLSEGGAR